MSRATLVVLMACMPYLAACGKLAEIAGAPNRDAAAIALSGIPDSLFVGDSVEISAAVQDKDGRPAWNDTVVVWVIGNPQVLSVVSTTPPAPLAASYAWMHANGRGQTTLTAHTKTVTASKAVTVVGAEDIAADDHRLGYALADQPAATTAYSPALRFNSSGGGVSVTHDSAGAYTVRFSGLARGPGQRDNVQVTAYGAPPGVHCKLYEWSKSGSDFVVPVHCHAPGPTEPFADSRFTVLVAGARVFDPSTPFAFSERLQSSNNLALDTSATSFNSVTGHIYMGSSGTGSYNFVFSGAATAGPLAVQISTVGQGAPRCRITNYDLAQSVFVAGCTGSDAAPTPARPSLMWLTRGRAGHRYAFATTGNLGATIQAINTLFTFNSAGGAVSSKRVGASQWAVTFAGLGRPAGGAEIVVLSAFTGPDHSCSIVSWSNTGTNDLTVTVQCFVATGTPFDGVFNVLVVE